MELTSLLRSGGRVAGNSLLAFEAGGANFVIFLEPKLRWSTSMAHARYLDHDGCMRLGQLKPLSDEEAWLCDGKAINDTWWEVGDHLRWALEEFNPLETSVNEQPS